MKRLLLLRHAKSDWSDPSVPDERRPLNRRGERARHVIAAHIAATTPDIARVLTSPAVRARLTAEAVAAALGLDAESDERLYTFAATGVLEVVRSLPDAATTVLLAGHNPAFEELSAHLTGTDGRYTTATVGTIELETDRWRDAGAGSGNLVDLTSARSLDD